MNPLDPSDSLIGKDELRTWLYAHDPKTILPTKLTRHQLAVKVREAQPHLFPEPESDAPALPITNRTEITSNPFFANTSAVASQPTLTSSEVTTPSNLTALPRHSTPSKEVTSERYGGLDSREEKARVSRSVFSGSGRGAKRVASSEAGVPAKSSISITKKDRKVSKKIKVQHEQSEPKCTATSVGGAHPIINTSNSINKVKTQHESPFIAKIDSTLLEAALQANIKVAVSSPSYNEVQQSHAETLISIGQLDVCTSTQQLLENSSNLMEFPIIDIFESSNPVIGREIQPIPVSFSMSSSNKEKPRSGAEVFQEERQKEEKLLQLEERLVNLERQDDTSFTLQRKVDRLEQKVKTLGLELCKMREDVVTHQKALVQLMTVGEEEDDFSQSEGSEE